MDSTHFDLIVIGSGSAGSSAWYNARQLGKSVLVFEDETLGGECPTYACVPTKALLHAAEVLNTARGTARFGVETGPVSFDYARVKAWKDSVVGQTGAALGERPFIDMGASLVRQRARFVSPGEVEAGGRRYTAESILIATGSRQRLPDIPGLAETGYLTFREAIELEKAPQSIFVLGGGAVGCEFSHLFRSFGAEVFIADHNPNLLPLEDTEAGELLAQIFASRGINVLTSAEVREVRREGDMKRVTIERGGRESSVLVEHFLVATGKQPNVELNLEAAGVRYSSEGIEVDENLRTSNPRVFAAGDVAGPHRYTHAASYQGLLALDNMFGAGELRQVDYRAMPRCVYTEPEVAAVGITLKQAREQGVELRIGRSEIIDNDRGLTSDQRDGFVKVYADADGKLLGGVIVSARAGEILHELSLAISLGATAHQVAGIIHAFPTFSEAVGAACAALE